MLSFTKLSVSSLINQASREFSTCYQPLTTCLTKFFSSELQSKQRIAGFLVSQGKVITNIRFRSQSSSQPFLIKSEPLAGVPKKKTPRKKTNQVDYLTVKAFSTADEYRFPELYDAIEKKTSFQEVNLAEDLEDDVIALKLIRGDTDAKPSHVYIFRQGSMVLWNVDKTEEKNLLQFLRPFEAKSYPDDLVHEEMETMQYIHVEGKSRIIKNVLQLTDNEDPPLSQYAVSNALALSVKLAVWEASLDYYVDSIKHVSEDIRDGKKIKLSRDQVFRKTGELFTLRHHINLSSDLLDTPDFYWDRQALEALFLATSSYLNINKRTKVMNEKLNHCLELINLVSSHLNDHHHVRLELMIIILIMVEVIIEFTHYF